MLNTQVNKASSFSFELVFPLIPLQDNIRDNKEFIINIFETVVPGVTLDASQERWQGGIHNMATGALTFEPWNVNFIVDSEFKNWRIMYQWFMFINNNYDKYIDEHDNYSVDASLRVMNNFQKQVFSLYFVDVWPTSMGEIQLSYRDGEPNLETQVSLAYDRYEIRDY
jgi:hypothetical protein